MIWDLVLCHGLLYSLFSTGIVVSIMRIDNRVFLPIAYLPEDLISAIPQQGEAEKRRAALLKLIWLSWAVGFPVFSTFHFKALSGSLPGFLFLFLHAFLVFFSFWLVDLVFIDGIILCWVTPEWVVVPGTEGYAGYKDFGWHLRGHFGKGLLVITAAGLLAAVLVMVV
ncbi:MAG: hypothetical protein JW757_06110 [Anaerolineales bacterium]|nr:hypothetical protein [Anaerolineales bacterium]